MELRLTFIGFQSKGTLNLTFVVILEITRNILTTLGQKFTVLQTS